MDFGDLVTICIPTHFVVSCPGTKLIETVYNNIVSTYPCFLGCKVIVGYDNKNNETVYYENLCKLPFVSFVCNTKNETDADRHYRQRASFKNIVEQVKTDYLLFFEHDWVFVNKQIEFESLITTFSLDFSINSVWFNKRKNILRGCDYMLEETANAVPLCKTSRYSNNPNFARTSLWKDKYLPIINGTVSVQKKLEISIYDSYKRDIRKQGFLKANILWGSYLYGHLNDGPYIHHLDGNKWNR